MTTRHSTRLLLIALLAIIGITAPLAQNQGSTAKPAAATSDIPRITFEKYTLPNGLDVILRQDRRLPVVAVDLWYHVGPANEEKGRTGFAHLFEHMMFQCSKHVPCDQHFQLLEAAGASDVNGTTDFDRTNYFETVPSNQLELALWLESDRMGYLLDKVDQAALANQQDVVRNERRQSVENQPYGLAEEAMVQLLYPPGHPYYGNVIGSHEDIQAAKLDDVQRFFRQYYAPNNASLAIVGDIDVAQTKALVQKYFSTLRRGPAVPPIKATTPRITTERRKVVASRVELPRVYMAWITPAFYKPGDADADIAATLLGGGRSSRLYKKLVYEQQIAQDVSAQQYSLVLGSIFQIQVTARPGRTAAEIEKALDAELTTLRTTAPAQTEVDRARNTIETNIVGGLESLGGFGGVADRLNAYNHYLKTPDYLQQDVARYRAVTPATVRTFARTYLTPSSRVVVHAVPGEPQAAAQVPTPAASAEATAPKPAAGTGAQAVNGDEPWRAKQPQAAAAKPVQLPTPQSETLANGLTLILNERRGLPVVAASVVLRTGSDANPLDKPGLANFTAAMLDEGTASRSALQIADQVAQLGATLGTGSSMDATTITGRSLSKNFGALLALIADVTLHPSFPAEELDRQRAQRLGQLVQMRDNPSQVAGQVTAMVLYGDKHPYGYSEIGTEASVKAITRADLSAFWQQNFVANNAALVVAGDISMKELRAMAEKSFGSWQRGTPARPALTNPTSIPPRVIIVDKPGSPQTQLRVATIGAARSSPDFRPLQVMNIALGGLFSSRINMNLREKNGYTYGASSQFTFRRAAGPFQVGSGVRTDVTAPSVSEIFKEIRGMVESPMDQAELQRAKDSLANSLAGAFETSADAVANFSNVFIYDLGLDYYTKYAQDVNRVTTDQTLAVSKRYLVPGNMVVVAVGDRKVIEPELAKLNVGKVEIRDAEGRPAK
ncbi:MAG TPA: pitrilysin family protein [Vicinamibacterales bacterium]|nr:pitrilysin family protein [Vicinamibacterales bacterium]